MFNKKNQQNKDTISFWAKFSLIMIVLQAIGGVLIFLINPKRWLRFFKKQKKEINDLTDGKEGTKDFLLNSSVLLKDLFIPHLGNGHKPKILRPKSLLTFAVSAIIIKAAVTGFLFFTYPTPAELSAIMTSNMIALINDARNDAGAEPLRENLMLDEYAKQKGTDMISRGYFAHDTPDGKRPWEWIDRTDYDYVYAGENLAMDFISAEVVQDAFMKSPGHRRNILNPKYKDVGIAVLNGKLGGHETTLLVEFFGTERKDLSSLVAVNKAPSAKTTVTQPNPSTPVQPMVISNTNASNPNVNNNLVPENVQSANTEALIVVAPNQSSNSDLINFVIEYSNIFFIAFLIFMLISLILNIVIKFRIQHPALILQSVVVIALMAAMVLVKFHFAETISPHLLIL
ncbi:MAG: CAP domain-containing protein [Patescibacteria group bacterium]|nr:CAP domain-containing protein [Patescibacteria group bacterium]